MGAENGFLLCSVWWDGRKVQSEEAEEDEEGSTVNFRCAASLYTITNPPHRGLVDDNTAVALSTTQGEDQRGEGDSEHAEAHRGDQLDRRSSQQLPGPACAPTLPLTVRR